jgi:hypothetical protein
MRVKVLRVSGMPHNVDVWVDEAPGRVTYYVDASLITPLGARVLEIAATNQRLSGNRRNTTWTTGVGNGLRRKAR